MDVIKTIRSKDDFVVRAADFVVEHKQNEKFNEYYVLDTVVLGEGAYGKVFKCVNRRTMEERAVKIVEKSRMSQKEKIRLKYEINILKNLVHPSIVRLYEVFEDKTNIFLVQELCDGRELFEEI
jgi:calcium-dependent protein kinase